jgi:hypothetical protein
MNPRRLAIAAAVLLNLLLLASPASADVFRPAYLQLQQTSDDTFNVLWKVPAIDAETVLKVKPQFPDGTQEVLARSSTYDQGTSAQRWRVRVPGGLEGRPITFTNLAETGLDVLVRVECADGSEQIGRIRPAEPSFTLKASPGPQEVARTYTVLGIEHILTGFDHLLFVLALIIITRGGWLLARTVTAFTISHGITLTAATLGFIRVPGPPVEAVIALSIVFVATECVHSFQGRPGITERAPWLVALTFGLLHGLGFASALGEVGLPRGHIPMALLFFSAGVEIGHFLFVGSVLALIILARRSRLPAPRWARLVPPYAIGSVATFWLLQRITTFWN